MQFKNFRLEKKEEWMLNSTARKFLLFKGVKIIFKAGEGITINRRVKLAIKSVDFVYLDTLTEQDAFDFGFNFEKGNLERLKDMLINKFGYNRFTKIQRIRIEKL